MPMSKDLAISITVVIAVIVFWLHKIMGFQAIEYCGGGAVILGALLYSLPDFLRWRARRKAEKEILGNPKK